MADSTRSKHVTIIIGPQPPPTHGASLITSVVTRRVRESGTCVVLDTTVEGAGLRYHGRRASRHLRAAMTVWRRGADSTVYLTGVGGHALLYQVLIVAVCRIVRVPVVYHHHSYAYLNERSRGMAALAAVGRSSIHHVTLSTRMAVQLRQLYPDAVSGSVCSNTHFLPPFGPRSPRTPGSALRIGHLSNLTIDKGLARVVAAFEVVLNRGVPAELHLAGPASSDEAATVLERTRREIPGVRYWGRLSHDEVPDFMRSLDLFVFPSTYRNEAQPLVVLEALLAGVPVLALPVGCLTDLLDINGHHVPDETAFTAAVLEVASRRQAEDVAVVDAALASWAAGQLKIVGGPGPTFMELLHG